MALKDLIFLSPKLAHTLINLTDLENLKTYMLKWYSEMFQKHKSCFNICLNNILVFFFLLFFFFSF